MKHSKTTQTGNTKRDVQTQYFHTALQLARMYGVAETLHPIPFLPMDAFFPLIEEWATEYENQKSTDILTFFEGKIPQKKQDRESP